MKTLLLSPHNDDETLFAAYLCLRHRPRVVVCLRSYRMADPRYPGGMPVSSETRERETEEAMRLLGCAWTQLPCPDSAPASALEADLREALSALGEYEYVLAPLPEDGGHEQHNLVGRLAREIFGAERVCHYATYAHGRRSRVGRQVEIEPGWVELKRRALASYRSQARHPVTAHWFSEDADLSEFVSP